MTTCSCSTPDVWAEDGTPSPRSYCAACHGIRVEPEGWKPADPPRVWRLWRVVENERRVEEI